MSKLISMRLSEDEIQELNELAELESLDRSALLHKLITEKVKEMRMKRTAESYRKGTLTLKEAATASKVSIYEMMEYIEKHGIYPKELSGQDMDEHFEYAKKILNKEK